jgi:hypothetical protein
MGVEFHQFTFRWMNCKLLREFPFELVVRLWDTYFSEPNAFEDFHVYVCTALLLKFSAKLKAMTATVRLCEVLMACIPARHSLLACE